MAEISYVATSFDNPLYAEEMNILDFLKQPDITIVQALLLKFKPVNMDVLPLYIILLLLFPPILWLLHRWPTLALGASLALYVLTWEFGWNFPPIRTASGSSIRSRGSFCSYSAPGARSAARQRLAPVLRWPSRAGAAVAYLVLPSHCADLVPAGAASSFRIGSGNDLSDRQDQSRCPALRAFPCARGDDGAVRAAHWPALKSPDAPAILCGQHSLEIFCLGVFLSFAGHFALVEISGGHFWMQVVISLFGIVADVGTAALITWYKDLEGRSPGQRPKSPPDADLAGGGA